MSEEDFNSGRDGAEDGEPRIRLRSNDVRSFWHALAGLPALALIGTLFVALIVGNRNYADLVNQNIGEFERRISGIVSELSQRLRNLEEWSWKHGRR